MTSRERILQFWDTAIARFLDGGPAVPDEVEPWFQGYRATGQGHVVLDAIPEPYLGDLGGRPLGVFLALNPGRAFAFQRREGAFADDIRAAGSYSAWAAGWPYVDGVWDRSAGRPNRHHRSRLQFLRRWSEDGTLPASAMLAFELYPWHSTRVTARMSPDPGIIREYVWEPVAELDAPVFAFGAPWFEILEHGLRLPVVGRYGSSGQPYGSAVPSRSVIVFEAPAGTPIVAEKHAGSAGPPSADETRLLRSVLDDLT